MPDNVINVVFAGIGGQGVLKASDILADAAFLAGYDVKKSELHGMAQRGGSVSSDVRFGKNVLSPMIPVGTADFLIVLTEDQVEINQHALSTDGTLMEPALIDIDTLDTEKALNVAMLGALSECLGIEDSVWHQAIESNFPEKLHESNERAFEAGKAAARARLDPDAVKARLDK